MEETKEGEPSLLARYGPRALILGGSEGIGLAFAERLAAEGFALTLVARNAGRLASAAATLRDRHGADVVESTRDLTDPGFEKEAVALIESGEHGLVIYNAGATHGVGLFTAQPVVQALDLVRLNCIGPVAVSHAALTTMRKVGKGGLIIVSSMAGMAGSGFVAAYAAAKSFEMTLVEGLHWEAARLGIDVMCAVPTLTDTPAMARSGLISDADPAYKAMSSDSVAAGALAFLGNGPLWFAAGEASARALRTAERRELSDAMSRTAARMWGIAVDEAPLSSNQTSADVDAQP
jgi:short-subunit dehydrogenase